jgi:hypothetical protein
LEFSVAVSCVASLYSIGRQICDVSNQKGENMASRSDYVSLIRDLVDAVYQYSEIDPYWDHISTQVAGKARDRMYNLARQLMFQMCEETLSGDDIDEIFGWVQG